jgi:hypothetical protein
MNYVNITDANPTINIVLNYDINLEEGRNGDDIDFYVYKDGSDERIAKWSGNVVAQKYYQRVGVSADALLLLEDETQYNLVGVNTEDDSIVYRGKLHTTKKDITDYSINKDVYVKKTTSNNYTILD